MDPPARVRMKKIHEREYRQTLLALSPPPGAGGGGGGGMLDSICVSFCFSRVCRWIDPAPVFEDLDFGLQGLTMPVVEKCN